VPSSSTQDTTSSATDNVGKLLSLVSHEFRTPASVVAGYLRMLLRDPEAQFTERQRHMIEEAEKSCSRMAGLLGELSELGRLEQGTASLGRGKVDVFSTIAELAPSVLESSERGVHLDVRGAASGAVIDGDGAKLRESLVALCRAVLREQPASCRVAVDRRLSGGSAAIAIAHEDEVEQVWAAAPTPFNEHRGGLGLLLPIARRVIERHGGRVASVSVPRPASTASSAGGILVTFDLEPRP
jgi:signal transduction histidine kinase